MFLNAVSNFPIFNVLLLGCLQVKIEFSNFFCQENTDYLSRKTWKAPIKLHMGKRWCCMGEWIFLEDLLPWDFPDELEPQLTTEKLSFLDVPSALGSQEDCWCVCSRLIEFWSNVRYTVNKGICYSSGKVLHKKIDVIFRINEGLLRKNLFATILLWPTRYLEVSGSH